jgi:hypothetical protein
MTTTEEIREFVIANHKTMTNKEIGLELNADARRVARISNILIREKAILKSQTKSRKEFLKKGKKSNTYNNAVGKNKMSARIFMVSYIIASKVWGKILTLPNWVCTIEKLILKQRKLGISFVGVECKKDTYWKLCKKIWQEQLPMSAHFGFINEIIDKAREGEFAHLILDYCGQLHSFAKDIETALTNKIVPINGTIHITLSRRISGKGLSIIEEMESIIPYNGGDNGRVQHSINTFLRVVGRGSYEIVKEFPYNDKSKGSSNGAMILFILKRIK